MSDNPPSLPRDISPDGREIWDWAAKLSAYTQSVHEIRRLANDIARIGKRCGDCDKWMKSRECPAERNINGLSRGPSCEGFICSQFIEAASATKRRAELQEQLAKAKGEHASGAVAEPEGRSA
jgi:hypothetical protein